MQKLSPVHHIYYTYTENECEEGKSYVVNAGGQFYLYMGDDKRSDPAIQIIVTNIGGGDLHYLPIERKKEITIITTGK